MALPGNVNFGTVTGAFLRAVADSPLDADRDPEGLPVTDLTVVFEPGIMPAIVRDLSAVPPVTILIEKITATVNAAGVLTGPDGQPGIRLVASTDPDIQPTNWTWTATFQSTTFPTVSFSFALDPDATVDLATVVRVPSSPGATLDAWLAAVAQASAARDAAIAAAASVPSAASLAATYVTYDGNSLLLAGAAIPIGGSANSIQGVPARSTGVSVLHYRRGTGAYPSRVTGKTNLFVGPVRPTGWLKTDLWMKVA